MGERRLVLLGLGMAILVGFLVYFRLWFMDYTISSDEMELLRRQFDLANREAMDESAEWRMRYDREVERASICAQELSKLKESYQKVDDNSALNKKLQVLRKVLKEF
uniref:Uncharacterized protein n=1 Tax=Kalanchoe fedtschenkoi TaxID=63787 RepID=A0A7N0R9F8_KALFE